MIPQVVAAVVERDEKLLVCLRPARKQHGGLWEFPGGKLQDGETIEDAVARELHEELAVETTQVGNVLFSTFDQKSGFEIIFIATAIRGTPVALEHDQHAWCSPEQVAELPLAPSDREFVSFLMGTRNG